MAFVKGESANPNGRPKGSLNRKTILRQELEKDGGELAELIKAKARAGDATCMSMWLARLEPPLKPRSNPTRVPGFDATGTLTRQTEQVLQAMADGVLTTEDGSQFIQSINALAGIRQVDDLQKRIEALEQYRR